MNEEEQIPDLTQMRVEYRQQPLLETDVNPDPVLQLVHWLNQAIAAKVEEPNAMVLATCDRQGRPSARFVLCKKIDQGKLAFFTNYDSHKGRDLTENPRAAVVFFWAELQRQVRAEGEVEKVSEAESDVYFAARPMGAKLGAWASPQTQIIASRQLMEDRMKQMQTRYPTGDVPRPSNWGGYWLRPDRMEFWQGRPNRLHDRLEYFLDNGQWKIRRLGA